jgi:hypothetical protein
MITHQRLSLATITCTWQTKEEESRVRNEVIGQKEAQPYIVTYTPPHLRNNGNSLNIRDQKPMILLLAITGKMEPRTLKLKGSIKNKNITILVESGSTHNFMDIILAKQLNLFVYPMKDLIITIVMVKKSKE